MDTESTQTPTQIQNLNLDETTNITTQSQAVGILINAIEIAQKRGAFNLEEAEILSQAKKMFIKQPNYSQEKKE